MMSTTKRPESDNGDGEKPIVISPTSARGATVNPRVFTILVVSLAMAIGAMIVSLAYFYALPPFS